MRLIDVRKCSLEEPYEIVLIDKAEVERGQEAKLRYAILSHRWQREEVTLRDLSRENWQSKYGAAKLVDSVKLARADGHQYLWLDTCCIDKDSSADLSEAINSMYRWYADADICYAYLADVDQLEATGSSQKSLEQSVWFKRGWTLQELLAPYEVTFYSSHWQRLGQRQELADTLAATTGIPSRLLRGQQDVSDYSIAQRMSWASGRQTEREEDIAYSLMGLFSVDMPLLYGGGSKAFLRLQEEVLRHSGSDDYTIFAWRKSAAEAFETPLHGLLADSPSDFSCSTRIERIRYWRDSVPITMTSNGLFLESGVIEVELGSDKLRLTLPCASEDQSIGTFLEIRISPITGETRQYARIHTDSLRSTPAGGMPREMYFPQSHSKRGLVRGNIHRLFIRSSYLYSRSVPLAVLLNQHPFNYGGSERPGKNRLDVGLLKDGIVGPINIPCWHHGVEAMILFHWRDLTVNSFYFIIVLGTTDDGGIGYQLMPKESSALFHGIASSANFQLNGHLIAPMDIEARAFAAWSGSPDNKDRIYSLSPLGGSSRLYKLYGHPVGAQFTLTVNVASAKTTIEEIDLVLSTEIAISSPQAKEVGSPVPHRSTGRWFARKNESQV